MPQTSQIVKCQGSFSDLADCNSKLPTNTNPTKILFFQLFPVKKRGKKRSLHLTFQPLNPYLDLSDKQKQDLLTDAIDYLQKNLLAGSSLPSLSKKVNIAEKRNLLLENNFMNSKLAFEASDDLIQQTYKNYYKDASTKQLDALSHFTGTSFNTNNKAKLSNALLNASFFNSHFTESDKNCLAILATYEQEWAHQGYTRGELVKTVELAPGETITLEYHYWDKSIVKSENDLSTELELKQSSTLTQRETKHLLDELTKNNQLNLKGNFGQNFKLEDSPISFNGSADGGINSQVTPTVSTSIDNVLENVVNISNDFKQNHRVRIEETRDTGKEEKQTRIIANTNRCHTLQFNYFEILSNYCVTTRFKKFTPCLLVPYQLHCNNRTITSQNIDYKFILCNEYLLKGAILDKAFLPGFEAAKKIASFDKLKLLVKEFPKGSATNGQIGAPGSGSTTDPLESRYSQFRNDILKDYDEISESAENLARFGNDLVDKAKALKKTLHDLDKATKEFNPSAIDLGLKVFDQTDKLQKFIGDFLLDLFNGNGKKCKRLLYFIGLSLNNDAIQALNKLKSTKNSVSAHQAIETFVRSNVTENDFQFVNPITGQISEFFNSFGVPDVAADFLAQLVGFVVLGVGAEVVGVAVGGVVGSIIELGIGTAIGAVVGGVLGLEIGLITALAGSSLELLKDDAGLHNDVQAAMSFFKDAEVSPTGAIPVTGSGKGSQPAIAVTQQSAADLVSLAEIADAQVELERLICHIKCHFEHYKQVLWLNMDADARSRFLIKNKLDAVVANEVVGFYNGMVAFRLLDLDIFKGVFDTSLVAKQLAEARAKFSEVSSLITIPTSSTILTGQLGECDLCELYIQQSRTADVRQQHAKAALDEAEVNYKNAQTAVTNQEMLRMQQRIVAGDLTDPIEHSNGRIDISVKTQENNP